jgi:hypothetical protein
MSFPSANKETGPRLALLGIDAYLVAAALIGWMVSGDDDVLWGVTNVAIWWCALAGLILLSVPEEMSVRARAGHPRFWPAGLLLWPGRARAYLFHVLSLALVVVPVALLTLVDPRAIPDERMIPVTAFALAYALLFPALPSVLFAYTRRRWGMPQNLLRATLLVVVLYVAVHGVLEVLAVAALSHRDYQGALAAPLHALNPIFAVVFSAEGSDREAQIAWNVVVCVVTAVAIFGSYIGAIVRALRESISLSRARRRGAEPPPADTRPGPAPSAQQGTEGIR